METLIVQAALRRSLRSMRRSGFSLAGFCCAVLLTGCANRAPEQPTSAGAADQSAMDTPLSVFKERITSSSSEIAASHGATLSVPVTVENTGASRLIGSGKYPITLSYRWFDAGKMLPIEGERTVLPHLLNPGEKESFDAKVVVPRNGSELTVKFSLVQEGVAWFFSQDAAPLEIHLKLKS